MIDMVKAVWGNRHGGSGGIKTDKIAFDFPFEILTHITGYFGMTKLMGPTAVKPLTFHTTKRDYGPYRDKQGTFFASSLVDGMIIGFHGRSGWYIDSVGVHSLEGKVPSAYGPSSDSKRCNDEALSLLAYPCWSGKPVDSTREIAEEVTYGLLKEPAPTGPGPWGGDGGNPRDDGVYSGTKQAYITRGDAIVYLVYQTWKQQRDLAPGNRRVKFDKWILLHHQPWQQAQDPKISHISHHQGEVRSIQCRGWHLFHFHCNQREGRLLPWQTCAVYHAIDLHMQHWLGEKKPTTKYLPSKNFFI